VGQLLHAQSQTVRDFCTQVGPSNCPEITAEEMVAMGVKVLKIVSEVSNFEMSSEVGYGVVVDIG